MDIQAITQKANALFAEASFLSEINSDEEYQDALELMDSLIDDYDNNKRLIELLSHSIDVWENTSEEFEAFNQQVSELDSDIAVLRVLMDQYRLKASDLENEIGSKSLVSMILNGSRNLTTKHIKALSVRFHVSPSVFLK